MKKISIGIMIVIIGLVTVIFALPQLKTMKYFTDSGGKEKYKNIITTKTINPMQKAVNHLLGTWTYTSPTNYPYPTFSSDINFASPLVDGNPPNVEFWTRFQFNANKTCAYFQAFPTDNEWGKAHKCKWNMKTDKYANTGQRFYYAKITPLNTHSKFWRCSSSGSRCDNFQFILNSNKAASLYSYGFGGGSPDGIVVSGPLVGIHKEDKNPFSK